MQAFLRSKQLSFPWIILAAQIAPLEIISWSKRKHTGPEAPVIILDVGESPAFDTGFMPHRYLHKESSQIRQMAELHGAIMIMWEHRFYGNSTPCNITSETPASEFKFLTTEQALADVAQFAWSFERLELPKFDLTPAYTPWIFVGGSYPGMRAAFMRKFYPNTIHASWASSAPVQARLDFSSYSDMTWRGMQAANYANRCRV
jgi:hypothetical protein